MMRIITAVLPLSLLTDSEVMLYLMLKPKHLCHCNTRKVPYNPVNKEKIQAKTSSSGLWFFDRR